MDRPIADRSNVGHFVPPSQTKAVTLKKKMTFDQLKAELPTLDKHPYESDIVQEKADADKDAGGSSLFKGERVRDVATCITCDKVRCIYGMYSERKVGRNLSKNQMEKRMSKLEAFKEDFVCGMECPVDELHTRQSIRCGEFVESQYFVFARNTDNLTTQMCCFCCSEEDIMTTNQIAEKVDCGGKAPLPLCKHCLDLRITPPMVNASTNFAKKSKEGKSKKKRQADWAVASGYRKARAKTN